jgi:CheY-like chemotaxis protein
VGGEGARRPERDTLSPVRRPALRLLLAEDNVINQRLMLRVLEKAGHQITLVRSGRAALEALSKSRFDMVLMDVQMPEMDGFEATAAIRARERVAGGHLPLVAITAHAMRGDRERCLQAGFDGYVSKPIQFETLFETIDELAPRVDAPAARPTPTGPVRGAGTAAIPLASVPPAASPPAPDGAPSFAESTALERTGGDRELLEELIGVFLTEMPKWMRELKSALSRLDATEVHRVAHTVKGAVDSCGAARAYDAAMLLERMGRGGDLSNAGAVYATLDREIDRVLPELAAYATQGKGAGTARS